MSNAWRGWSGNGKPLTPEGVAQAQIMAYLRATGWKVDRNQQGLGNKPGRADIKALRWGVTINLEIKAPAHKSLKTGRTIPAGKPSADQLREQAEVRAHGGIYEFVSSVEEVERIVRQLRIVGTANGGLNIQPEKNMRLICE